MTTHREPAVLVLTSTFPRYSGDSTPPFVLHLCQALQKLGWRPQVLVPHARGMASQDHVEGIACTRFRYAPQSLEQLAYGGGMLANVKEAGWRWLLVPAYLGFMFAQAAWLLWQQKIRVVHAHWVIPQGVVGALLKMMFGMRLRLIVTAHGSDLQAKMGGMVGLVRLWVLRRADSVAVVSQAMREQVIASGIDADKVVVAPMGVNTEIFCPSPLVERSGLLFVGRLVEGKGVHHLLDAVASMVQHKPDITLQVVGDGPARKELEARVRKLGIASKVNFLGARSPSDVPAFFQKAEVLVMPSLQEGLGLVAAEALSCLCPVVAFDIPGVRDIVIHGKTGLLATKSDSQALAKAVTELLETPGLSTQLASAGREHVLANYSWPAVARRYHELLIAID